MQDSITIEEISNVEKKIMINVDADTVNQKFQDFFDSIKKDAMIPGFRKGKAPVSVLRRYFGERAKSTISQMLISEYYQRTIRDHNLSPIGTPRVAKVEDAEETSYPGQFGKDNTFSVELEIDVLPKVDPQGYKDLTLDLPEGDSDALYEEMLLGARRQFAERKQLDGPAELGDSVVIDFKGFIDDEPFNGGEAEGFTIEELGAGTLIPGFEEQVVGMSVGEDQRIKVQFPDEYSASHLAGKPAEFDIKLHNVVRKTLAEVDDDLAMIMSYENVQAMEDSLRAEATKASYGSMLATAEQQIVDQLIEQNEIDLPDSLITAEKSRIIQQFSGQPNMNTQILSGLVSQAERNLKKALLFEAIFEKEDLEVNPEELNEYLEEQAEIHNMDKDEIVSNLYNSNQMEAFVGVLRGKKVVDLIINQAQGKNNE